MIWKSAMGQAIIDFVNLIFDCPAELFFRLFNINSGFMPYFTFINFVVIIFWIIFRKRGRIGKGLNRLLIIYFSLLVISLIYFAGFLDKSCAYKL